LKLDSLEIEVKTKEFRKKFSFEKNAKIYYEIHLSVCCWILTEVLPKDIILKGDSLEGVQSKKSLAMSGLDNDVTRKTDFAVPGNTTSGWTEEEEEKARLTQQVLELQNTLSDLSSRVDNVKEENFKLKSENQVLGQYIENLMAASSVFQSTSSPKTKKTQQKKRDK